MFDEYTKAPRKNMFGRVAAAIATFAGKCRRDRKLCATVILAVFICFGAGASYHWFGVDCRVDSDSLYFQFFSVDGVTGEKPGAVYEESCQVLFNLKDGTQIKVPLTELNTEELSASRKGEPVGCHLLLVQRDGKQLEVPLASQRIVGGHIETKDFGSLKVEVMQTEGSGNLLIFYATRSQIARLRAFQAAHRGEATAKFWQ